MKIPTINGKPIFQLLHPAHEDPPDWESARAARWNPWRGWHHPKDKS